MWIDLDLLYSIQEKVTNTLAALFPFFELYNPNLNICHAISAF